MNDRQDRRHAAYGREIVATVVAQVRQAYPLVPITSRDYETGVWAVRAEFRPLEQNAVPIWLAANIDDWFVLTAGDTFRWELPFTPEERDLQVEQLVDEIRQLADYGVVAVRTNRLLGAFSTSVVGSPGIDPQVDEALRGRLSSILEERTAWE
jgi:hypothetical protein